jgi:hypothetical protein
MLADNLYGFAVLALIAWVILIYFVVARPGRSLSSPRSRRFDRTRFRYEKASPPDFKDVGQQLHAVMTGSFERRRLLNRSEYQAFKIIEADIAAARRGYRVFAQTSLGEVLMSPDENAFHSINSKRVDILIVDQGGWPVAAVEYQGDGHYQGTAAARDAVKKEALRKAGIRYVEITATDSSEQVRLRVREQLGWQHIKATAGEPVDPVGHSETHLRMPRRTTRGSWAVR